MRRYIFTWAEEEQLIRWLKEDLETVSTTKMLSRIRNSDRLALHVELFSLALRKLEQEGRPGEAAEAPLRFGFKGVITLRKVKIKPDKKRREYVQRLENIVGVCEEALSDPDAVEVLQLKAADVIIRAIRMSYVIVREVDIENLERHARAIQRRLEERDRESQRRA